MRSRGCRFLAGTDEVGRGCLAGPVVAAAVILPEFHAIEGIKDSKLLSPAQREKLYGEITEQAVAWGVGVIGVSEIDRINIFHASLKAMSEAVGKLKPSPDFLLIDGKHKIPFAVAQRPVVKGDRHCESIAAASIVAKVSRDRMMAEFEREYPNFTFSVHKGYPTEKHREELREHGPLPIHRRSFNLLGTIGGDE